MNRAIASLVFVCAFALCAWGAGDAFTTGTSFEDLKVGVLDPTRDDRGVTTNTYWTTTADTNGMHVIMYGGADVAYDYAAKGTVRNPFFEGGNTKYLGLDIADPLERGIFPLTGGAVTNVMLKGGIHSDTLARFTTSYSAPAITNSDKIAVWLRERENDDGSAETNLIITAGYYVSSFDRVLARDYVLTNRVAEGEWCRLTVCTITNITDYARGRDVKDTAMSPVPCFTVYIDGRPAAGLSPDYSIGAGYRDDILTPEARLLRQERRLFPWLVGSNDDRARSLSRFAFAGQGATDDILFTTERPEYDTVGNVFTLMWDRGVKSLVCVIKAGEASETYVIDTALTSQGYRDFALGANTRARVIVTNVVYDTEREYKPGVWTAQNDCSVTDRKDDYGVFVYDGPHKNPIGRVVSSRDFISVGGSGCETFAEAKRIATAQGEHVLMLETDVLISTNVVNVDRDNRDYGRFTVAQNDDLILDLNGHTLQGINWGGYPTIHQTGGRLEIIDSAGGGRVLPPLNSPTNVAVSCYRNKASETPTLVISGGSYEGEVSVGGKPSVAGQAGVKPVCSIAGGSFTNLFGGAQFYLEQYATNATAYFALEDDDYWRVASPEGSFIWNGRGEDEKWTTPGNWRGGEVPGADDLVIFPRAIDGTPWSVDFGTGVALKRLWMDADVKLSGTCDFTGVTVESGAGCFVGEGTMSFTNALPGALSTAAGSNGVRIGEDWRGTVRISKIVSPVLLTDIDSWGVAGSKVKFAGVCGYVKDKSAHALPYELVLMDDGATSAWKNETGYTGSTISFPKLSGDGTFESPKNAREVGQVFKFVNVEDFMGRFLIGGKKLVLGSGSAASGSRAGTITFVDGVSVRSGYGWNAASAYFGNTLNVCGVLGETLMTYSSETAPSVGHVIVTLYDEYGESVTTNMLRAADGKITIVAFDAKLDGHPVSAAELSESVKSGSEIEIPNGSAVSVVDGRMVVNGYYVPDYYKLTPLSTSSAKYAVSLDEDEVKPTLADFALSSDSGRVVITVTHAKRGLKYGLRSVTSLAESFEGADVLWVEAVDDIVTFEVEAADAAGFYQVIVTD